MAEGFVYILVSPNSNHIKIGGTEHPISKRLKEINRTTSYGDHGPWRLSDFLQVADWQAVEYGLHNYFRASRVGDIPGTRELFGISPHEAREQLWRTDVHLRIGHDKTTTLFQDRHLQLYLYKLFQLSGLFGSLDIQGAWTLTVLTSTMGGRWFTLNIGSHEVAFSTNRKRDDKPTHYLVLDQLIRDCPDTVKWIKERGGKVENANYRSARDRAVTIYFQEPFASAEKFFGLRGARRALIAYWLDSLADLRERSARSAFARFHSYDAVAELMRYKRAIENIFAANEMS